MGSCRDANDLDTMTTISFYSTWGI